MLAGEQGHQLTCFSNDLLVDLAMEVIPTIPPIPKIKMN